VLAEYGALNHQNKSIVTIIKLCRQKDLMLGQTCVEAVGEP